MNLRQLEAFYWAAHCTSFAAAAERVHLTVSSLSKRLAELEGSLGQALFDRSGHRAVLTPAGERLLPHAQALLRHAQEVRTLAAGAQGLAGSCRIGSGELTSITWLPRWVSLLRQQHPALSVSVTVGIGEMLAERLDKGELDAAVIAGPAARPALQSAPIGQATFQWCAAPALARRIERLDAQAWAQHTLVTLPRGSGVTHILDEWMDRAKAQPRAVLTCNQWGAAAGLIAAGEGVGMLPGGLAAALQQRKRVKVLPARHKLRPLAYGLHFRHGDPRPLLQALRETCEASADFDAAGPFF